MVIIVSLLPAVLPYAWTFLCIKSLVDTADGSSDSIELVFEGGHYAQLIQACESTQKSTCTIAQFLPTIRFAAGIQENPSKCNEISIFLFWEAR